MELIGRIERRLMAAEKAFLTILIIVMSALSALQVVLRGVFSSGLLWADTFLRYLVLWVGFLGAALAAAEDKQFSLELAERFVSARTRRALHLAVYGFTAVVCAFLSRASLLVLEEEYRAGRILLSIGTLRVPAWTLECIIPAGFLLLIAHYLLKSASAALSLRE